MNREDRFILRRRDFDALPAALVRRGYIVVGPTVRDGAIVYAEIAAAADLPVGWTDEQEAGRYRLRRRDDEALFGFAVGPQSLKSYQWPAETRLWRARIGAAGELTDFAEPPPAARHAFLGVRSCDLHAAGILDTATGGASGIDAPFIVAVQCGQAGGTCFCVSMGTGPVSEGGFDLALTEIIDGGDHYFVVQTGSEAGAAVLAEVPHAPAGEAARAAAGAAHARAADQMGRRLDTTDIRDLLYRNLEHPRWLEVADRCLTCGNCTMVCPTCFCTSVQDTTELDDSHVERRRSWDSCFTVDHSQLSSGPVRASGRSRYRQWMTHKLAGWWDQFGSSGCVGCGRCITWCPVGIDITEEAAAIRRDDGLRATDRGGGSHAGT